MCRHTKELRVDMQHISLLTQTNIGDNPSRTGTAAKLPRDPGASDFGAAMAALQRAEHAGTNVEATAALKGEEAAEAPLSEADADLESETDDAETLERSLTEVTEDTGTDIGLIAHPAETAKRREPDASFAEQMPPPEAAQAQFSESSARETASPADPPRKSVEFADVLPSSRMNTADQPPPSVPMAPSQDGPSPEDQHRPLQRDVSGAAELGRLSPYGGPKLTEPDRPGPASARSQRSEVAVGAATDPGAHRAEPGSEFGTGQHSRPGGISLPEQHHPRDGGTSADTRQDQPQSIPENKLVPRDYGRSEAIRPDLAAVSASRGAENGKSAPVELNVRGFHGGGDAPQTDEMPVRQSSRPEATPYSSSMGEPRDAERQIEAGKLEDIGSRLADRVEKGVQVTHRLESGPHVAATINVDPSAHRPDLGRAAAAQMASIVAGKPDQPVEIALNPEELGRVRMTLSTSETSVTVQISADRPETVDLMRRHIDQLAVELRRLGYDQVGFEFSGNATGGSNGGNGGIARPAPASDEAVASSTIVEGHVSAPSKPLASAGLDLRL
ncbi:MAG: flagellar hook-length control protein FliK [Planctomycetes bacterium]|nr:flagellar hook-length control protein FliK [Planctomycetota bacterium]